MAPAASFLSLSRELRDMIYEYYITATHNLQPAIANRFPSPRMSLHDALRGPAGAMMHVHPKVTAEYKEEIFKYVELVGKYHAQADYQRILVSRHVGRLMGQSPHFAPRIRYARFHIIYVHFASHGEPNYTKVPHNEGQYNWARDVTDIISHLPGLRDVAWRIAEPTIKGSWFAGRILNDVWDACRWIEQLGCGSRAVRRLSVVSTPAMLIHPMLGYLGPTSHVWERVKVDYVRNDETGRLEFVSSFDRDGDGQYRDFLDQAIDTQFYDVLPDPAALTYQDAYDAATPGYETWVRAGCPEMDVLAAVLIAHNCEECPDWVSYELECLERHEVEGWREKILSEYGDLKVPASCFKYDLSG